MKVLFAMGLCWASAAAQSLPQGDVPLSAIPQLGLLAISSAIVVALWKENRDKDKEVRQLIKDNNLEIRQIIERQMASSERTNASLDKLTDAIDRVRDIRR